MNVTFDHKLISSFKEYLDHKVVENLGAWKNSVVSLHLDTGDDRLVKYKKVSAGPQQWLYDSSIFGATIASPQQFSGTGWQAAKTDFKNARFLVPSGTTGAVPTSGLVAVKHFNSYVSSKDDEELFENTLFDYPPEMFVKNSASKADSYHAPCFFVKYTRTMNKGFAMGGLDQTTFNMKVTCFCKTEGELLGMASVFRDIKNTSTYVLNNTPLNEFDDLKSRPWSFHDEITAAQASGNSMIYIDESIFNPIKSDNINSKFKNIYIGLGNINISVYRYPRQ